jgi:hypothetical protein
LANTALPGTEDFYDCALSSTEYTAAKAAGNIQLAHVDENDILEFSLNNNYTIRDYPGVRNPLNDANFRKAIACMIDKNWIIATLGGLGTRIDVPIAAPQTSGWADPSVIGVNYPYPFSLIDARAYLDAAGFIDVDFDGTRNYPADWPGRPSQPNLDPIKFLIRTDNAPAVPWATITTPLIANMTLVGVPVVATSASSAALFPIVMDGICNYHIYTDGYTVDRYPTYWLMMFHSDYWPTQNYVTGVNADGLPNYPGFDDCIHRVYYADMMTSAVAAAKDGCWIYAKECISIPLWSTKSYWGYNKLAVGMASMYGYGLENTYTFLNSYKVDDPATPANEALSTLSYGTINPPTVLNPLFSQHPCDYAVLDRIFPAGQTVEPYNLATDNPGIIQDWEVSTWTDTTVDPPVEKTKVTYWIRRGVKIVAPVTGAAVRDFTAYDLEFTQWYGYAFPDSWNFAHWQDVEKTVVLNNYEVEFYFSSKSMWFYNAPTNQLFPRNEWLAALCGPASATFASDGTNCSASVKYAFTTDKVVEVTSVTCDGAPLTQGVDYEILASGKPEYERKIIHFLVNQPLGMITVNYYRSTVDPHGYFIGSLPWKTTMYSVGPYYLINIIAGAGGVASFGCNTNYFMETPPLGEIDWMWTWTGYTMPRSGYYQVFLYDAVKLLGSYCARGSGTPDANYLPGADIDAIDLCHVGLYDAVTLLSRYGMKFGIPPT